MNFVFALLLTFISFEGRAEPQTVEFIFLSHSVAQFLPKGPFEVMEKTAEASFDEKCVPMGDGCFHPQVGYVDKAPGEPAKKKSLPPKTREEFTDPQFENIYNPDVGLISCDRNNHFDIFCGAEKGKDGIKLSNVDIWIDTSASMRNVDFSKSLTHCGRRRFAEKILSKCRKDVSISVFNTARKKMDTLTSTCINNGLNNGAQMVKWIRATNVKHLIVITDVEEYVDDLRAYIDNTSSKVHGIGAVDFSVDSLAGFVPEPLKKCLN